jgi:hypothetical protein
MIPHKHYDASEIEEALEKAERTDAESIARHLETHAEESTIRRWIDDFSKQMPSMATRLEQMAVEFGMGGVSLTRMSDRPLQRLRRAVELLQEIPMGLSRLAYAFRMLISHPVCVQCPGYFP